MKIIRKTLLLFVCLLFTINMGLSNRETTINIETKRIDNIVATMYHPVIEQCDVDFNITADGSEIDIPNASTHKWIAVSRDLLLINGGYFRWGDVIYVFHNDTLVDRYEIRDTMNKRWTNRIDILETPGTPIYKFNNVTILHIKPIFVQSQTIQEDC